MHTNHLPAPSPIKLEISSGILAACRNIHSSTPGTVRPWGKHHTGCKVRKHACCPCWDVLLLVVRLYLDAEIRQRRGRRIRVDVVRDGVAMGCGANKQHILNLFISEIVCVECAAYLLARLPQPNSKRMKSLACFRQVAKPWDTVARRSC